MVSETVTAAFLKSCLTLCGTGLVAALLQYALSALPADLSSPLPVVEIKINDTRLEGFFSYFHHAHHLVMGHLPRWPRNEWSPKLGRFKTWDAVEAEAAAREEEEEVGIEDSELVELARMRDTLATPNFGALLTRVENSILKKPRHGAPSAVPDLVLGTTHQVRTFLYKEHISVLITRTVTGQGPRVGASGPRRRLRRLPRAARRERQSCFCRGGIQPALRGTHSVSFYSRLEPAVV